MLELTLTAAASSGKIDLKVPTSKLLFKATYSKTAGVTALAAFITACATATVTATRFTQNKGNKSQMEDINLLDLAEIAAMNEGYIFIEGTDAATTATAKFSIELSNSGAVAYSQQDFNTVQFRGFSGFTTVDIHSLGAHVELDAHLKYSKIAANANEQVRFNCAEAYAIVVPDTLTKLKLQYSNGVTQDIEGEELALISPDINEIVYNHNGLVLPANKWRIFPLPSALRGELTLSAIGYAFLLSNKNYEVLN